MTMDVTQVVLRSLLSQMSQRNSGEGSEWKIGALLKGIVLEMVLPDTYTVKMDGKKLSLQSPYPLTEGQEIELEIQGVNEKQIQARLIPPGQKELAGERTSLVLRQVGIDDNAQNRTIFKALTSAMLPLSRENFQQAARAMTVMGKQDLGTAQIAAFALKAGLPLDSDLLQILQRVFTDPDPIQGLQRWINDTKQLLQGQGQQSQALSQLEKVLQQFRLSPDDGTAEIAQKLESLFKNQQMLGKSTVSSPTALLGKEAMTGLSDGQKSSVPDPNATSFLSIKADQEKKTGFFAPASTNYLTRRETERVGQQAGGPAQTALIDQEGDGREHSRIDSSKGEKASGQQNLIETGDKNSGTLAKHALSGEEKSLLPLISRAVKEVEQLFNLRGAERAEVLANGAVVEEQWAGQQILQGLNKGVHGTNDYLYFSIPYRHRDGSEGNGQLRVYKDGKNRTLDPKNLRLALVLDTEHLGPIAIELALRQQDVISKVTVKDADIIKEGMDAWPELQKSLSEQGFRLHSADWKVGTPPDLSPQPRSVVIPAEPGQINIRI
ncbi:hypothetical protein GJ688_01685 [Heliobacillus mobilis]|uniref:Hook-length control protein FliK n=1 Tax=Heliobacterium mobile TaxID=28064 RepID=A0A6I3SBK7_HELMO|nr:flagellar hook-length control protein FliK [Heliobacterium mobile]MTV47692.1 hypothetical protein [Heliobacterium mobile]